MYKQEFKDYTKVRQLDITYFTQVDKYLQYCQLNTVDVIKANYATINKYVLAMQTRGCSNGYINVAINAIRCYYKYLFDCLNIPVDLENIKKFKMLKHTSKFPNYLTQKEVEEVVRDGITYIDYMEPLKMRALILFMFFTGLRLGELTNLRRADVDLRTMKALIRTPNKSKTERWVYYPPKVAKLLYKYFDYEPEDFNCFNVNRKQIRYLVHKLNDLLPMKKKFTPHSFRHSFTHMLIENEIGVRMAQKLLGHKSMNSTLVYYNPTDSLVERIYRKNIGEGLLHKNKPNTIQGDNNDTAGTV